jgi:hypothetical protein
MKRLVLLCALAEAAWAKVNMPSGPVGSAPPLPVGPPQVCVLIKTDNG